MAEEYTPMQEMVFSPSPWKSFFGLVFDAENNLIGIGMETKRETGKTFYKNNANLFSSAPDLLAAVEILLIHFGTYKDGDGMAKLNAINFARAAISKAKEA